MGIPKARMAVSRKSASKIARPLNEMKRHERRESECSTEYRLYIQSGAVLSVARFLKIMFWEVPPADWLIL